MIETCIKISNVKHQDVKLQKYFKVPPAISAQDKEIFENKRPTNNCSGHQLGKVSFLKGKFLKEEN